MASRDLCNAFWLWDRTGKLPRAARDGGYCVYPSASLFNHSCVPNVRHDHARSAAGGLLRFRAIRAVRQGEPLEIRYLDPALPDKVRAAALRETWGFEC